MASGSTLHDVAALARVSPRTVSRVVNGEGGFGEETRRRVVEAIEMVGYRPNLLARALITRRSGTIGLVVPEIVDPFFAELAEGVQAAVRETGRTMFIASHGQETEPLNAILSKLASFAVDGAIVFPTNGDSTSSVAHAAQGLRTVMVDVEATAPNLGSIISDIKRGAELAVEHLVARGRKTIAMIGNTQSAISHLAPRRESGFRSALHAAGQQCSEDRIQRGPPGIEGGRAAMHALLDRAPQIDGVLAYNDMMAIGALQALAAAGRNVPHDVSLVGFDDVAICSALVPALTSVRMDRARIGREAVAMLDRLSAAPGLPQMPIMLDVELIVRASS